MLSTLLSQSTWRNIGLGLTTTFFALGALCLARPVTAAAALGVHPTSPEGHDINQKSMTFLGIRDVAVAVSLFYFYAKGKTREMGVLTSSWVLVCVTDTWVAVEGLKGRDNGGVVVLVVGAVATAVTGLGLLGL